MSLNDAELQRTRDELAANLALTGLTLDQVAGDLGYAAQRLRDALAPRGSGDPADVWLLRDYLEQAVRDGGGEPAPFTVLTEPNRRLARQWFSLQEAPRHDFAAR